MIHPFADGYGRVARALASVYFYRVLSIPFLVFANQKLAYLSVLNQADRGQARPLLAFFRDRGIDTMQLVMDHLLTADSPEPAAIAARLRLTDEVALKLLNAAGEEIQALFLRLKLPIFLELHTELSQNVDWVTNDYRQVMGGKSLFVAVEDHEHERDLEENITILIPRDTNDPFPFRLVDSTTDELETRFEDVHPEISAGLRLRLENWCSRFLARMLEHFENKYGVNR